MPDRRETMGGWVAKQKIDYTDYFTIPDYRPEPTSLEEGDEEFVENNIRIPAKMIVCPTCDGKGSHVNPSIDSHGITQSEMYELGDDFREDYFSGVYDVPCAECGGRNVVLEADRENLDEVQREVLDAYESALADEAQEIYYRNMGYQF